MNRYLQIEKWMKYAIKRTNQITNENEMYHQDCQRVQAYYEELAKGLNPLQKELLDAYYIKGFVISRIADSDFFMSVKDVFCNTLEMGKHFLYCGNDAALFLI